MKLAKKIFDVAKADFEETDPDKIRAGELRASMWLLWRRTLRAPLSSPSFSCRFASRELLGFWMPLLPCGCVFDFCIFAYE